MASILAVEIAYCEPGIGNLKVEFTITVPAGTVFYRLVDADTTEVLASATEEIAEPSTITRNFVLDMPHRNLWLRLEVGRIIDATETIEAYYAFPTWTWYEVAVTEEEVEGAAAPGDWTSYTAKMKYIGELGDTPMPEDFRVRLLLILNPETFDLADPTTYYTVATGRMVSDVYTPETYDLALAFQVPPLEHKPYPLKLQWYGQALPKNSLSFGLPPGNSTGVTFILARPIDVLVTDETVEHAQAPGHWTSYHAMMTDADGQSLPDKFYVQLMLYTPTPVQVPFENEYLGTGNGVATEFPTEYAPIVSDTLTVYIDKVEVPKTDYTVDYAAGKITFNTAPLKKVTITCDYTAECTTFPIVGVNLRRDVYFNNKAKFAFKVPDGLPAGTYSVWLQWKDQVIGDKKYLAGTGAGTTLTVLGIIRSINVTGETTKFDGVETLKAMPGIKLTYEATIADNLGNALPEEAGVKLVFKPSLTCAIEEYLKPLKIYVKNTDVWLYSFTENFKIYDKGVNWARVGFEIKDVATGNFESPKLYLEVLNPTEVRITVEAFTDDDYSVELWYGDELLTGAVEEKVGGIFNAPFEMIVSRVSLIRPDPADPEAPYIYDPTTKLAKIAFEVPNLPIGIHTLRLEWADTVVADTKYLEGKSTGLNFEIVPPTEIVVTGEGVENQAPGQWTSYTATITDEDLNPMPRSFYVKLFMDDLQVAGVNLAEDVYKLDSKLMSIAFEVPTGTPAGWKTVQLRWDAQVADGKAFPAGKSAGTDFGVTDDVKHVEVTEVALEKPYLTPTLKLTYAVKMNVVETGSRVPETLPLLLKLLDPVTGDVIESWGTYPDTYDEEGRILLGAVLISFTVPENVTPGTYPLELEWRNHVLVTAENPLGTKYEGGSHTIDVTVIPAKNVRVYDETVEHPQAVGQWVSYIAKIEDENGDPLPCVVDAAGKVVSCFYVNLVMEALENVGVNLIHPDPADPEKRYVYNPTTKQVKIAFQVPELVEGFYPINISWETQVINGDGYMHGESSGASFQLTKDIRTVEVALDSEWVEKTPLKRGEETTYHAESVIDERTEPILSSFATTLVLDDPNETAVAAVSFAPDVYNPATRTATITFKVPNAAVTITDYYKCYQDTVTITVNGASTTLTEGVDWNRGTSNNEAAVSLASAINLITGVSASAYGATVGIIADAGYEITLLSTSDPTHITVSIITAGAYRVKLKWQTQVCNSRKYIEGKSEGAVIQNL